MKREITIYRPLEGSPDNYQDWLQQGNAFYEIGRYIDSLLSYDRALENAPFLFIIRSKKPQYTTIQRYFSPYQGLLANYRSPLGIYLLGC
jgi:tetratricopeptide (TPR) repeat protein